MDAVSSDERRSATRGSLYASITARHSCPHTEGTPAHTFLGWGARKPHERRQLTLSFMRARISEPSLSILFIQTRLLGVEPEAGEADGWD
jgi:hypothetical protein